MHTIKCEANAVAEVPYMDGIAQTCPPLVSVCMPMYNASEHLRECIDSVLSQTFDDFEFIIVDDGSTDDSVSIVESYTDSRIRLIRNRHDYIASLNTLLESARGKYIARMDADDVMMADRLKVQFEFMEDHPLVDLVASGMQYIGGMSSYYEPAVTDQRLTPRDIQNVCCIAHPTTFIRCSTIRDYHLNYRQEYRYAEDYKLWADMLCHGLCLVNIKQPLLQYRVSPTQISCVQSKVQAEVSQRIRNELKQWISVTEQEVMNEARDVPTTGNKLTLVIPFLNERDEVANTVRSAREFVGDRVDIIVINDCSTDGYDYEADLAGLNVYYVKNLIGIGAAASKEKGARLSTTPYFILLDAHMRFYDDLWLSRYVEELERDDNRILCCQTKWLCKKNGVVTEGSDAYTRAAFLRFCDVVTMPGIHWANYLHDGVLEGDDVPAVMGATYGASKRFWNKIRGLQGLIHYGCEEAYISIKAYLLGGCCSFIHDVSIGHIYREVAPYRMYNEDTVYNNFWIMQTLFPTSLRCLAISRCMQSYPDITKSILDRIGDKADVLQDFQQYYRNMQQRDFDYILDINDQFVSEEWNEVTAKLHLLPHIVRFVMSDNTQRLGLYCGIMGKIILLCNAFDTSREEALDDCATQLFSVLEKNIDDCYCWNFNSGLSGIGWGLIYLHTHGFIDDVEDLLELIDQRLICLNVRRISDFSFDEGLGGVLAYVVARIGMCQRCDSPMPFDVDFINDMAWQAGRSISVDVSIADYRSRNYAMQLMEYENKSEYWQVLRPELWEIFDFPNAINENTERWSISVHSSLGHGLYLLDKLQKIFNIPSKKHEIKFL